MQRLTITERVRWSDVDFAVIPFDQPDERFRFERLLRDSFSPIVPRGHRLATKKRVTLADLAKEPLVTMPPEAAAWASLKSAFGQAGLEFQPRFQTQSSLSVVAMVAAGLGVGFVTKLGAAQITTTGVTTLALADVEIGRDVGIVTVRGRSLSGAAATFCKTLREVAPSYSKSRASEGNT